MNRLICLLFALSVAFASSLWASCGSSACPINTNSPFSGKKLDLTLLYEYVPQKNVYIGQNSASVGEISGHHDEIETINQRLTMLLFYQLNSKWRVRLEQSFVKRNHEHMHHHHGEDIEGRWAISGFGDTTMMLDRSMGNWVVSAGVKLPTGETRLKNAEGEEAELPLQPGTGSTDYLVGVLYQRSLTTIQNREGEFVTLPIRLNALYTFAGEGQSGWQFGNTFLGSAGTAFQLTHKFRLDGEFILKNQAKSNTGTTHEPGQNTGGTWVFAGTRAVYQLTESLALQGQVWAPIFRQVNGIQLTEAYGIRTGLTVSL